MAFLRRYIVVLFSLLFLLSLVTYVRLIHAADDLTFDVTPPTTTIQVTCGSDTNSYTNGSQTVYCSNPSAEVVVSCNDTSICEITKYTIGNSAPGSFAGNGSTTAQTVSNTSSSHAIYSYSKDRAGNYNCVGASCSADPEASSTYNAVAVTLAFTYTVSGTVYLDNNGNDAIDVGVDQVVPNVDVTLSGGLTARSGNDGRYVIRNVISGSYTISAATPPDYKDVIVIFPTGVSSPFPVPPGQNNINLLVRGYRISGTVYDDKNHDCVYNGSDTLYSGADLTLNIGGLTYQTGASGVYSFVGRPKDTTPTSTVTLTDIPNYILSTGTGCSGNTKVRSTLLPPDQTSINFYITRNYSVEGNVYLDYNHNCIVDSTEYGTDAATNSYSISASSGNVSYPAGGTYRVANLVSGTYTVTITPSGYLLYTQSPCAANTISRSIVVPPDVTPSFNPNPPPVSSNFFFTPQFNITGRVWIDYHHNATIDSDDIGKSGATLTLSGAASGTTTTDANGDYVFNNLYTGDYTVTLTVPAGYSMSINLPNSNTKTLNANQTINFYITPLYSISGNVFNDVNKNKCKDGSYSGCTGTAESNYIASQSSVKMTHQVTGEIRTYNFTGSYTSTSIADTLVSGIWKVEYTTLPPGWEIKYGQPYFTVVVGKPGTPDYGGSQYSCDPNNPIPTNNYNTANCWHDTNAQTVADGNGSIRDLNFAINNSCPWATLVGADVRIEAGVDNCVPDDGFPTPTPTPTPIGGGTPTPTPTPPICGSADLACCSEYSCTGGLTCIGNICSASPTPTPGNPPDCGSFGQVCCAPSSTCNSGLVCVGGICTPPQTPTPTPTPIGAPTPTPPICGGNGQLCCAPANSCNSGLSCTASGVCAPGVCPMFTSIPGSTSYSPGLIISGNNSYSFCLGGVCPSRSSYTRWIVGGPANEEVFTPVASGTIRTSYDYISTTALQSGITPSDLNAYCGSGGIANCNLSPSLPNGIYKANGNLTLFANTDAPQTPTSYQFQTNKQFVILVNGDLKINGELKVQIGSTLLISAKGNITVDENVGTTYSSVVPSLEGFFSAGGSFDTGGNGGDCTRPKDKRLNINGAVVVNANGTGGSYINNRDMCEDNLQCPSYSIKWRPDFIFNAPEVIKHPTFIWQEVAP